MLAARSDRRCVTSGFGQRAQEDSIGRTAAAEDIQGHGSSTGDRSELVGSPSGCDGIKMILLDVNILVSAHRSDADQHREIKSWLEAALSDPAGVAVSELALSGCLRVITHPKIFKKPTPLAQALDFLEDFRSREEVHLLGPGAGHWIIFGELCRRSDARGNLVPDAFHAALAIELGCEWLTLDRGFARFPGLKWRHPLD